MTLTVEEAKALVTEFCATYPIAAGISYKLRETQEELYGPQATKTAVGKILGAFRPGRGQADFATSNFCDADEFKGTLRHEVLGHFGINTFNSAEKRAILDGIIAAREQPGISVLWTEVSRLYVDATDSLKAEEVFAFACENIEPQTRGNVADGTLSFSETCIECIRPMQLHDLTSITTMVAEGMRDRTRSQQNFPASDLTQFHIDGGDHLVKEPHREMAFIEPSLEEQLREQEGPALLVQAVPEKTVQTQQTRAVYEDSYDEPGMDI